MAGFREKDRFERFFSPRAQVLFFAAIFVTFAPLGLLVSRGFAVDEVGRTFTWIVYYGLAAVGWAWSFTKDRRLLFIVIPVSLVAPRLIGHAHLTNDDAVMMALIIAGFVLVMFFVSLDWNRALRLQTEIGLARDLHLQLVPIIDRTTAGLEIYGTSSASSEVGGDLLDVVELDSAVDLYLADVSGHGLAAGVLMGMTKSAIRMRVRDRPALGELIADLDGVINEVRKKRMLVTFAAIRFDDRGSAEYALAGQLPIVHFRPSTGVVDSLGEPSLPLGTSMRRNAVHPTGRVSTEPDDLFLLLTDGLTEVRDRDGKELGSEPIEELIRRHHTEPLSEIHDRILRLVGEHGPQHDDRTLLLARVLKRAS